MLESAITWAALSFALGALGALAKVYVHLTAKIEAVDKRASDETDKLRDHSDRQLAKANEARDVQVSAMQSSFALYREQIAREQREYITREMLREFEARFVLNADRIFAEIKHLGERIDQALLGRPKK